LTARLARDSLALVVLIGEIRRRARHVVGPVCGISLVAYFAYHLVQGDRGLGAWLRLSEEIKVAQATLDRVEGERRALDRHVNLLRPDHLDRDMLDERARAALNMVAPNERVIFYDALPSAPP
jgi:cell division protein FtsB